MVTLPASSMPGLPENITSSKSPKSLPFSVRVLLSNILFIAGNIRSISMSTLRESSTALFKSAALLPVCSPLVKKNCSGRSALGLKPDANLFKILSVKLLLYFNSFPLVANRLIRLPVPPITPVSKAPSVPNLILFNTSRVAWSLPPVEDSRSSAVGPPNKSPIVPNSSTSPTKTPSATPPVTAPAPNLKTLPFLFNAIAFWASSAKVLLLRVKYFPTLAFLIAWLAILVPYLKANPPGIPMLTRAAVIFPAVVASAFSSMSPNF